MVFEVPGEYSTIQDAVDAAAGVAGERVIRISGMQRLTAPLHLTREVQGKQSGYLRFLGADENAGICGAVRLEGFTDEGAYRGGQLYTKLLPEISYTRHLYVDGCSMPRPRTEELHPDGWNPLEREDYFFLDPMEPQEPWEGLARPRYASIGTTHREILGWSNLQNVEMVFETGWTHCIVPLLGAEEMEDGRVRLKPEADCFATCHTRHSVPIGSCPNWFENVFEELRPGQWYFSVPEHKLYLLLPAGDTPENHTIELPILEKLLTVEGTVSDKLRGITFEHLSFTGTTYLAPGITGHAETQANMTYRYRETDIYGEPVFHKTPSAICVHGAASVRFTGCTFTCIGSGAVDFECGAEDCAVTGCTFAQIAGSAVQVGDFNLADAHPTDKREIVRAISVTDCEIHDTGFDYRGSVSIVAGYVQDFSVLHNHIHHVPYSAVSIGWGWGRADIIVHSHLSDEEKPQIPQWPEPSVCMRNHVDYNHIHHVMQRLHDGGAIYTLGAMNGSSIIGNHIHDSAGYEGEGYTALHVAGAGVEDNPEAEPYFHRQGFPGGVYMDQASTGMEVTDNVFYHVTDPIYYHNQIPDGWKQIRVGKNTFNVMPQEDEQVAEMVRFAGRLEQ